jgi:hypothetical protein
MKPPAPRDRASFVALSSALTGFAPIDLEGTGNIDTHLAFVWNVIGPAICTELLKAAQVALSHADETDRHQAITTTIWNSPRIGPVAQALVLLWYTGKWNPLSAQWQETYRWEQPDPHTSAVTVSANAYVESLVWAAVGAHPPGAKPGGHGSWSYPPPAAPSGAPIALAVERSHEKQHA